MQHQIRLSTDQYNALKKARDEWSKFGVKISIQGLGHLALTLGISKIPCGSLVEFTKAMRNAK